MSGPCERTKARGRCVRISAENSPASNNVVPADTNATFEKRAPSARPAGSSQTKLYDGARARKGLAAGYAHCGGSRQCSDASALSGEPDVRLKRSPGRLFPATKP